MELIELSDDIFLYKDFISKEESAAALKAINMKMEKDQQRWHAISFYESYSSGFPVEGDPDLALDGLPNNFFEDLKRRFQEAAAEVARKTYDDMDEIGWHSQKWDPGAYAHYHSDNSANDGTETAFTRSRYAVFLYLNEDYDGGLLNFKVNYGERELSIKPETGMCLAFHGGYKNLHEVTMVTRNTRYTIGSFWDDRKKEAYKKETMDEWAEELIGTRKEQAEQFEGWKEIRESGKRIKPDGTIIDESEVF